MDDMSAHKTPRPKNIGCLIFPGFQALDLFGPLDILNVLSWNTEMNLYVISSSLDPVSTFPPSPFRSVSPGFAETILPTHDFASAPQLDVLIVPGGFGTKAPEITGAIDFIRDRYPSLQYLLTVCTGAGLAAHAGVLDGKHATTNKRAWRETTFLNSKVKWVAKARWVTDGNTWTSSGVSAGIDMTLAWVEAVFGHETATMIANGTEYERITDSSLDNFAELYQLEDSS